MRILPLAYALICTLLCTPPCLARTSECFNADWEFARDADFDNPPAAWEAVSLPHTAKVEPFFMGNQMWMGKCLYRKTITPQESWRGQKVWLRFEGAMHSATVKLNGEQLAQHFGGYLPFQVDIGDKLEYGRPNQLVVELDNRENPDVPPGKPLDKLDFAWYHGLYRNVSLIVADKLHISDPISENLPASGGVFVTYPEVSDARASVRVQVHVRNEHAQEKSFGIRCNIAGQSVEVQDLTLAAGAARSEVLELEIPSPKLWSPQEPNLHELRVQVLSGGAVVDALALKVGIRAVECSADGFVINGRKMFLRGSNRHQEYPYLGYALSDAAQWREAYAIKRAGFDIVRMAHYPAAPAFLDACDHYGLIVMEPIPGWQFFKDGLFAERSLQNARDMIRRDRNHPSCLFWETSLNETRHPDEFLKALHGIVGQEYPGAISASHIDKFHDLYIPARQHSRGPKFWDDWRRGGQPMFTAEYGDWEYYANNAANFNQTGAKQLKREESNSRQRRSAGETRLLQQALNFQESHNQNRRNPVIVGDANWVFASYNRGSAPDHCTSGIVDICRIPKFAHYFYQSQRPPRGENFAAPMVFIASYWNAESPLNVRVFSNCDEVELSLNGETIARRGPDSDIFSDNLNHPPFTFKLDEFQPGELKAVAYLDGRKVAEHVVRTPGVPARVELEIAELGNPPAAGRVDTLLIYARIVDAAGTLASESSLPISFEIAGAQLVSPPEVAAEAGIATAVVKTFGKGFSISAKCAGLEGAGISAP